MGQTLGTAAGVDGADKQDQPPPGATEPTHTGKAAGQSSPSSGSSSSSSMEELIAEALESAEGDEDESLDAKAQRALECPCVADLRKGPCGVQFSEAFVCFIKSTAEEKGSDCVNPFIALQECIKANPDAFSKDILDEDESTQKEEVVEDYKIIPPKWSKESKRNN